MPTIFDATFADYITERLMDGGNSLIYAFNSAKSELPQQDRIQTHGGAAAQLVPNGTCIGLQFAVPNIVRDDSRIKMRFGWLNPPLNCGNSESLNSESPLDVI